MDQIEPGKTFVRHFREGKAEQSYFAVITGVLGTESDMFAICYINRDGAPVVKRDTCTPVLPSAIRGGLIKFIAHHPQFGKGVIEEEEFSDGILWVILERDNHRSGCHPLTEITLCCPCVQNA